MRAAEEERRDLDAFAERVPDGLWDDLVASGLLDERVPRSGGG
ncbi:hypothetical protein ACGFJC_52185 [Nonomuraea fuscirosea]